jgi:xanthine dehydrogenase small subunit
MPLSDFYTGYLRNELEPGEFVQAVAVPLGDEVVVRAYKISKRYDSDISAVLAVPAVRLGADGRVELARFAFGGMAATVKRAAAAEAAVLGQRWDESTLAKAQAALGIDFQPMTDHRASAGYRLQVARNLLRRFWLETRADSPLAESDVSVYARAEELL